MCLFATIVNYASTYGKHNYYLDTYIYICMRLSVCLLAIMHMYRNFILCVCPFRFMCFFLSSILHLKLYRYVCMYAPTLFTLSTLTTMAAVIHAYVTDSELISRTLHRAQALITVEPIRAVNRCSCCCRVG